MKALSQIRFWQLMVGTGFLLLVLGLVMIFLPPGLGNTDPFVIEFFEASIESSEMGLALIVLGLSCFLIGRKDLSDLRTYQGVQEDLDKTSTLTAKLVAGRVSRTFNKLPSKPVQLRSLPDLDIARTRKEMKHLQNGGEIEGGFSSLISQAERGLELLDALEREGYSI
jgi:nitrate reductase gamma subunit